MTGRVPVLSEQHSAVASLATTGKVSTLLERLSATWLSGSRLVEAAQVGLPAGYDSLFGLGLIQTQAKDLGHAP